MINHIKIKHDITKIINEIDPWGLISAGAPEDEYDGLVNQTISLFLNDDLNVQGLRKIWSASGANEDTISEINEKVSSYFSNLDGVSHLK